MEQSRRNDAQGWQDFALARKRPWGWLLLLSSYLIS